MANDANTWEAEMVDELARAFPFPATPDVSSSVAARLAEGQVRAPQGVWRLRLTTAVLAALGLAVATLAASSDARDAVAEFLGLAVEGERIDVLPTPVSGLPTPLPEPVDISEQARQVSIDEAIAAGGFVLVRAPEREPLAVYVLEPEQSPVVVIQRYDGFDLWQFRTSGVPNFEKGVIDGRIVEEVTVNGSAGYWIQGGQRLVTFLNDEGTPVAGAQRTVLAPTLLWHDGERYLRIEGIAKLEAALRLAASLE